MEDAEAKAEKRRRAAYQAKLTRSLKKTTKTKKASGKQPDDPTSNLKGWDKFDLDGLLR